MKTIKTETKDWRSYFKGYKVPSTVTRVDGDYLYNHPTDITQYINDHDGFLGITPLSFDDLSTYIDIINLDASSYHVDEYSNYTVLYKEMEDVSIIVFKDRAYFVSYELPSL